MNRPMIPCKRKRKDTRDTKDRRESLPMGRRRRPRLRDKFLSVPYVLSVLSLRVLIISVVLVLLFCNGCGGKPATGENEAPEKQGPVSVQTATASVQTLSPTVDLVGSILAIPEKTAVLSSQVSGSIEKVCLNEGQDVHAGDEMVRLDARMARASLAKARAACEEAAANLALLKKGPLPAEIEAARQDVKKAAHMAENLQAKYEALKPMQSAGEISGVKYDEARSNMEAANAERDMAAAKLNVLEAGTRPESIAQAEANVDAGEADATAQQLAVELCVMKSPMDGVVTELSARPGMCIQPGTVVATIMDLGAVFARFKIPSAHLAQVSEGAHVKLHILSLGEQEYDGVVARIRKEADPQTGDVEAFASVANPEKTLRPNLACRVSVALPEISNVLVIPTVAVSDKDGTPVVTVIRDHKAYETEIKLGIQTPELTQVVSGLSEGETVAIKGGYGLPEGCPIEVDNKGAI